MAERYRSSHCHGKETVEKSENTWGFLVEARQGPPVEDPMHGAGPLEGTIARINY